MSLPPSSARLGSVPLQDESSPSVRITQSLCLVREKQEGRTGPASFTAEPGPGLFFLLRKPINEIIINSINTHIRNMCSAPLASRTPTSTELMKDAEGVK